MSVPAARPEEAGEEFVWEPLRRTGSTLRPRQQWGRYEFCAHGGLFVVVKDSDSTHPMETGRGVYARALKVWERLVEVESAFRRPVGQQVRRRIL